MYIEAERAKIYTSTAENDMDKRVFTIELTEKQRKLLMDMVEICVDADVVVDWDEGITKEEVHELQDLVKSSLEA